MAIIAFPVGSVGIRSKLISRKTQEQKQIAGSFVFVSIFFFRLEWLMFVPSGSLTKFEQRLEAARRKRLPRLAEPKADVPRSTDLRCFKFIVLAWGIGCMASVLEEELSTELPTMEYVSGSISKNGSQSLKNGRSKVLKRCTAQDVRAESRVWHLKNLH